MSKKTDKNDGLQGEVLLKWRGDPWRAIPSKLCALVTVFLTLLLFVVWAAPELGVFLLLFPLLLFGSAADHLVPSVYIITTKGIYQKNMATALFKPWSATVSCRFTENRGEVYFDTKSLKNRFSRSMPIYCDENFSLVVEQVRANITQAKKEG